MQVPLPHKRSSSLLVLNAGNRVDARRNRTAIREDPTALSHSPYVSPFQNISRPLPSHLEQAGGRHAALGQRAVRGCFGFVVEVIAAPLERHRNFEAINGLGGAPVLRPVASSSWNARITAASGCRVDTLHPAGRSTPVRRVSRMHILPFHLQRDMAARAGVAAFDIPLRIDGPPANARAARRHVDGCSEVADVSPLRDTSERLGGPFCNFVQ